MKVSGNPPQSSNLTKVRITTTQFPDNLTFIRNGQTANQTQKVTITQFPRSMMVLKSHEESLSRDILEENLASPSSPPGEFLEVHPVHQVEPDPEHKSQPAQGEVSTEKAAEIQCTLTLLTLEKKEKELKMLQHILTIGRSKLNEDKFNLQKQKDFSSQYYEQKEKEFEAFRTHLARKETSLESLHELVEDAKRKSLSVQKPAFDPTKMPLGDGWTKVLNFKAALETKRLTLDSLREEIRNEINKIPQVQEDVQAWALVTPGDHARPAMDFDGSSRQFQYIDITELLRSLPDNAQMAGIMKKCYRLIQAASLMAVEILPDAGSNGLGSVVRLTSVNQQTKDVYESYGLGENQNEAFVSALERMYGTFIQPELD